MSEDAKKVETAELKVDGKTINLPVYEGSEKERAVDIRQLRAETGLISLDPGYANTGSCFSSITYINGEKGILQYRGIPIEDLAEKSTFMETSYILINDDLPTQKQLTDFKDKIASHSMIHEDMKHFFEGYPATSHPMAILSSMICSLSSYYPDCLELGITKHTETNMARILSKVRTIAAFSYKKSVGQPFIGPVNKYAYVENFLHMMFEVPTEPYPIDPDIVKALELIFILHADHEQNCSTSTARMVGSSMVNLYASIAAAICALWGPLHGGANQAGIEMLRQLHEQRVNLKSFVSKIKDKKSGIRLMGFGHRVYKSFDPRAKILKKTCDKLMDKLGIHDPLLEIAKELEGIALKDDYFLERDLYPNVDFYSGIILRAIGIPENMFTVIFAIGRMPGWIAQWKEMVLSADTRICRPRQIYTGHTKRVYVPVNKRDSKKSA